MEKISVTIAVDASGNGVGYISSALGINNGFIRAIQYVKDDYADGIDVVISGNVTGIPILTVTNMNAAAFYYPMAKASKVADGTDAEYAAGFDVRVLIPVVDEQIKIVVSAGGVSKSGTFNVWLG